jgi:hypothetical protein
MRRPERQAAPISQRTPRLADGSASGGVVAPPAPGAALEGAAVSGPEVPVPAGPVGMPPAGPDGGVPPGAALAPWSERGVSFADSLR